MTTRNSGRTWTSAILLGILLCVASPVGLFTVRIRHDEIYLWAFFSGIILIALGAYMRPGNINTPYTPQKHSPQSGPVKCPRCGSEQVAGGRKGFRLGKAAVGFVAVGPIGATAGLIGRNTVIVDCLACGHSWQP